MNSINSLYNKKQYGLSLIEASMVLALSAVVIAIVMYYYNAASLNNKLQATEAEILSIEQKIFQLYDSNHTYNLFSLNDKVIIAAGGVPKAYINKKSDLGILNPFNGNVVILPDTKKGQGHFTMFVGSIPASLCTQMLTYNYGSNLTDIQATGGSFFQGDKVYGTMYKNGPDHTGKFVTDPIQVANQMCDAARIGEKNGMIGLQFEYSSFSA